LGPPLAAEDSGWEEHLRVSLDSPVAMLQLFTPQANTHARVHRFRNG